MNPLVLVQGTDGAELLDWATELYDQTEHKIVVAKIVDENQYRSNLEKGAKAQADTPTIDDMEAHAKQEVKNLIEEHGGTEPANHIAIGKVGKLPQDVYTIANDYDCDHLFVQTANRSPTGKAIFGDLAQKLILNFEGATTVLVDKN